MTAQQLAEPRNGNSSNQLFTTQRLFEELRHPHTARRAAAADAARRLMALAADRVCFFDTSRAEVWRDIFDATRLQEDVDRGGARRCPSDPMRATGAQLVRDALNRVLALRSGNAIAEVEIPVLSKEDIARIAAGLVAWTSIGTNVTERAA
jgi:hypothetical protein